MAARSVRRKNQGMSTAVGEGPGRRVVLPQDERAAIAPRTHALFERIETEMAAIPGARGVAAALVPLIAGNSPAISGIPILPKNPALPLPTPRSGSTAIRASPCRESVPAPRPAPCGCRSRASAASPSAHRHQFFRPVHRQCVH